MVQMWSSARSVRSKRTTAVVPMCLRAGPMDTWLESASARSEGRWGGVLSVARDAEERGPQGAGRPSVSAALAMQQDKRHGSYEVGWPGQDRWERRRGGPEGQQHSLRRK